MTRFMTRDRAAVAAALMLPLASAAILLPWRGSWSNTNVALLLVVAVVAVAATGNRLAGALAAVSAAAWFDFFFTQPYERFTISHSSDVTTFVLLLVVGLAVSQLAAYARRLKAITDRSCRIPGAGRGHRRGYPVGGISRRRGRACQEAADQPARAAGLPFRVRHAARPAAAARAGRDAADPLRVLARHDVGLPDEEIELRAFGNGQYRGRYMLTPAPGSRPPLQARLVAVTLADLQDTRSPRRRPPPRRAERPHPTPGTSRRQAAGTIPSARSALDIDIWRITVTGEAQRGSGRRGGQE